MVWFDKEKRKVRVWRRRRVFRAKKLAFGYVKRYHALEWRRCANFVLKEYKREQLSLDANDARDERAFDDVRWQAEASVPMAVSIRACRF